MDPLKLRGHLFGSLLEDVDKLGDVCLDDEAYANAIFDLFSKSAQEDSPAADLFRREKWDDLQSLLYADRPTSATFTGTCMRRALAKHTDRHVVGGRILGILNNDLNGEVITKALSLQEAASWDQLVADLAPHVTGEDASTIAWDLKRIIVDPDGLIEAIDADGAAGKITPRDAVERVQDVFYGTRLLHTAVEDFVKKLLPSVPPEFRMGVTAHLVTEMRPKRAVIEIHEAPVVSTPEQPPAPPAISAEQLGAQAYTDALADVVQLAKLIEPLTKAGLSSSDALEVANTAVGEAKIKLAAKHRSVQEQETTSTYTPHFSGLARRYGATILDSD